jgi:Flp pilus assembly protein TadG
MVFPLLSMLLIGIIYGGITLYDYVALDYAVAIGARTVANNRAVGSATPNACTLGETALANAAYGLNNITIDTGTSGSETFIRNSNLGETQIPLSTCTVLQPGDTVTMTATYPCNLTIPYAHINLCSVPQGAVSTNVPSGSTVSSVATGTCLYSDGCIAATATARIE